MAWGFFRPRTPRSQPVQPSRRESTDIENETKAAPKPSLRTGSRRTTTTPRPRFTGEGPRITTTKTAPPILKPTSNISPSNPKPAVSGQPFNSAKRFSSSHSGRSIRSVRSTTSIGAPQSAKSHRSSAMSIRTRHIKAAHAAKRAAAVFFAANRDVTMKCYTCGGDIYSIRCETCRTTYVPPEFRYNAASAALFASNNASLPHHSLESMIGGLMSVPVGYQNSGSSTKYSNRAGLIPSDKSTTTCSLTGAESLIGFVPESDIEPDLIPKTLDLELVEDLAAYDDAGLLEEIIFECFSNVDAVANTFCWRHKMGSPKDHSNFYSDAKLYQDSTVSTDTKDPLEQEIADSTLIIDQNAVKKMYSLLASVSSTSPMRGILQGAQAVLQVRQHRPLNEQEIIYISIILQCPAITECSMFTKITGPMQKLSRYAGLRSRARIILEVCAGLVANCEDSLHHIFVGVLANVDADVFAKIVDLANAYISHRLSFDFHVKTNTARPTKYQLVKHEWYADDWRVITVVKLLTLLYDANNLAYQTNKRQRSTSAFSELALGTASQSEILPEYAFYNTMVDFVDLKADYENWQLTKAYKKPKFSFCRYPFILSVGAKAKIFEHSIQREVNASIQRECFSQMAAANQNSRSPSYPPLYAEFKVTRQELLKESVQQLVHKWPKTPRQRMLKVEFTGEPGIDAGGLTREWIYLFFQKVFDPSLNLFVVDESTNYSWFGDSQDLHYYRATGMVLGFALFNGITVDINLPPLLFKLLLNRDYDLNDVATLWPDICQSLQQVLDYEGEEIESVFGLSFTAPDGNALLFNGENIDVNYSNRDVYVKLLVDHLLNAEGEAFQSFKSGFDDVCSGNTLLLFQPEELEMLVRGDRKPIDVPALRSVTKYVNFGHRYAKANKEPVVQWFWDFFERQEPKTQARLLQFATSTDRAPATGMVHMKFSIRCLGGDSERLPIAHTCFNELCLYKYKTRTKLESKLTLAISEHMGFGLK